MHMKTIVKIINSNWELSQKYLCVIVWLDWVLEEKRMEEDGAINLLTFGAITNVMDIPLFTMFLELRQGWKVLFRYEREWKVKKMLLKSHNSN